MPTFIERLRETRPKETRQLTGAKASSHSLFRNLEDLNSCNENSLESNETSSGEQATAVDPLTVAHEDNVLVESGPALASKISALTSPSCLVCCDLRYVRVVNQSGKPIYHFIDPSFIKESRKLPKLEFVQFMATFFKDPSIMTEGRPVNFDYGAIAIKVKAGHRPRHPAYLMYQQRASEGCQSCSLIVDVVESALPKVPAADVTVLAWAIQGYPLQLLITKCSETVVSSRELYLEVFTTPGKLRFLN